VRAGDPELPGDIGEGGTGVLDQDVEEGTVELVHVIGRVIGTAFPRRFRAIRR